MSQDKIDIKTGAPFVVGLIVAMSIVWIAWSGHFEPLLLGFGVFSIVLTVWLSKRLHGIDSEGQPLQLNLIVYE